MTLYDDLRASADIARIGLDRLRIAATDAEALAPHVQALRLVHDPVAPNAGILHEFAGLLAAVAVSLTEADDDGVQAAVTELDVAGTLLATVCGHLEQALQHLDQVDAAAPALWPGGN